MTTEIMIWNPTTEQWEVGWVIPRGFADLLVRHYLGADAAPERIYWNG